MESNDKNKEIESKNPEIKEVDTDLFEVCKSVCKIMYKNIFGTGFLIKLQKNNKELLCLITNEHVITQEIIESKEIIYIKYDCEEKLREIKLDNKERYMISDKIMDISIIEIKPEDKIKEKYFLLPYNYDKNENLINKDIYIVQYPEGQNLSHSEGQIKQVNNFEIIYNGDTELGSSGSPIFLKNRQEVLGIHKQSSINETEKYGTLISSILQFLNKDNRII